MRYTSHAHEWRPHAWFAGVTFPETLVVVRTPWPRIWRFTASITTCRGRSLYRHIDAHLYKDGALGAVSDHSRPRVGHARPIPWDDMHATTLVQKRRVSSWPTSVTHAVAAVCTARPAICDPVEEAPTRAMTIPATAHRQVVRQLRRRRVPTTVVVLAAVKWLKMLRTVIRRVAGDSRRRSPQRPVKTVLRPPIMYKYAIGMSGLAY